MSFNTHQNDNVTQNVFNTKVPYSSVKTITNDVMVSKISTTNENENNKKYRNTSHFIYYRRISHFEQVGVDSLFENLICECCILLQSSSLSVCMFSIMNLFGYNNNSIYLHCVSDVFTFELIARPNYKRWKCRARYCCHEMWYTKATTNYPFSKQSVVRYSSPCLVLARFLFRSYVGWIVD